MIGYEKQIITSDIENAENWTVADQFYTEFKFKINAF